MSRNDEKSPEYLAERLDWEADNKGLPPFDGWGWLHNAATVIRELQSDARRYRWLRKYEIDSYLACGKLEELDRQIDKVLKQQEAAEAAARG